MYTKKFLVLITLFIIVIGSSGCKVHNEVSTVSTTSTKEVAVSSTTQKIYKPKTKSESVQLFVEEYDLIERMPPEEVTDLSETEFIKCVEDIYKISLPKSTSFEQGGKITFRYEVLNKYEYNVPGFGVWINKLVTRYSQKDIDFILKQINVSGTKWTDCTESLYYLASFNEENIKEIVGEYKDKEYFIYVNYTSPLITVEHSINRYIFFMKEDNSDNYIVIFDGTANNYELQNGILEIQPDGSAKAQK